MKNGLKLTILQRTKNSTQKKFQAMSMQLEQFAHCCIRLEYYGFMFNWISMTWVGSISLAMFLSFMMIIPVATPGYLFLKKANALLIVLGSQVGLTILVSIVHYFL